MLSRWPIDIVPLVSVFASNNRIWLPVSAVRILLKAAEAFTSSVLRPLVSRSSSSVLALSTYAIHSNPFVGSLEALATPFLIERFRCLYA